MRSHFKAMALMVALVSAAGCTGQSAPPFRIADVRTPDQVASSLPSRQQWHVRAGGPVGVDQGLIWFHQSGQKPVVDRNDTSLAIRTNEAFDLLLTAEKGEGGLEFDYLVQAGGSSVKATRGKIPIPVNAEVQVRGQSAFKGLTEKFQVLWRADIVKDQQIVQSVVYVARLAPISENSSNVSREATARALEVISAP